MFEYNAADVAHRAVYRKVTGENVTPATITSMLVDMGATTVQALSATKVVTALIPTVTSKSLNTWVANNI